VSADHVLQQMLLHDCENGVLHQHMHRSAWVLLLVPQGSTAGLSENSQYRVKTADTANLVATMTPPAMIAPAKVANRAARARRVSKPRTDGNLQDNCRGEQLP
jgi:hypothetical protein